MANTYVDGLMEQTGLSPKAKDSNNLKIDYYDSASLSHQVKQLDENVSEIEMFDRNHEQ